MATVCISIYLLWECLSNKHQGPCLDFCVLRGLAIGSCAIGTVCLAQIFALVKPWGFSPVRELTKPSAGFRFVSGDLLFVARLVMRVMGSIDKLTVSRSFLKGRTATLESF